jgi:hypothetical protein
LSTLLRLIVVVAVVAAGVYIAHLRSVIDDLEGRLATVAPSAAPQAAAPRVAAEQGAVTEAPPAAADAPVEPADARLLTAEERAAMVAALSNEGMNFGSPVWFETVPNDPNALAFQKELQSAFEDAGWIVKETGVVGFAMKPGVYLFAADEDPPDYVDSVAAALEAGGVVLASNGRGYRAYFAERKAANPQWVGFEMGPEQTFVLAIGRQPAP